MARRGVSLRHHWLTRSYFPTGQRYSVIVTAIPSKHPEGAVNGNYWIRTGMEIFPNFSLDLELTRMESPRQRLLPDPGTVYKIGDRAVHKRPIPTDLEILGQHDYRA